MKKIPKRESARRNILYLAIMFVAIIIIIVMLPILKRPTPQLPPESPEISAKRMSPDNVYIALRKAVELKPSPQTKNDFAKIKLALLQDPVHKLVTPPMIKRIDILDPSGPALEKMREALEKPYCLWPIDWTNLTSIPAFPPPPPPIYIGKRPNPPKQPALQTSPDPTFEEDIAHFLELGILSMDEARNGKDFGEEPHLYLKRFLDAIKLAMIISEDGTNLERPKSFLSVAIPTLYDLLLGINDDDLRWFSEELAALDKRFPSLRNNVEFQMRVFANPNILPFGRGISETGIVARMLTTLDIRKYKFWLASHKEAILEAVDRNPEKITFFGFLSKEPNFRNCGMRGLVLITSTQSFSIDWSVMHSWVRGANIMTQLERYRLRNGHYPERLNDLEPDYFASTPTIPINDGKPFTYARARENYELRALVKNEQEPYAKLIDPLIFHDPELTKVIPGAPAREKRISFK